MATVWIEQREGAEYHRGSPFHPDAVFPEYLWDRADDISTERNEVYDMVRKVFLGLGLDIARYGSPFWNPLKSLVRPGMTVLLKPNMVLNWHPLGNDPTLDTMITHPSLVRAVADYVCIALKGRGKIIIADAPLQSCDFNSLIRSTGYVELLDFFKTKGVAIDLVDLRQVRSVYNEDGLLETNSAPGDPNGYKIVDLGRMSMHDKSAANFKNYRVTNYDHRKMREYHSKNNHRYLISSSALSADAIISLPKLKTHRKAGMTASLKNFIGIIGHKDCLPHHTKGSKAAGGDEYLENNAYKRLAVCCEEFFNIFSVSNKHNFARLFRKAASYGWAKAHACSTDCFSEGSWYGNDTIWRTTLDLVRIAHYADKLGCICESPQRQIFSIAEAIVAGEKEGPLTASPKNACIVAGSLNLPALDLSLASIMGFDFNKLPTVKNSFVLNELPLTTLLPDDVFIGSNNSLWDKIKAVDLSYNDSKKFSPPQAWSGHVELDR